MSYAFRNLEDQAGRGGVREQTALGVGDARFRGGGTAADTERAAFGAHHATVLGHALDEGDLELQRGVAGSRRQRRMHRQPHRRIQQRRGVAAMHGADRIVVPEAGNVCITTAPGSAVKSKGSMVCMIGGAGKVPSKIARTKSTPAIDAMTSVGVTPYSTLGGGSSIGMAFGV